MTKPILLSTPHMSSSELEFVKEAFATNWIAPVGPHVDAFESEFCQITGAGHAAAVSSGTAAIHLALRLLGVESGDEVFCSTLTFAATANPIVYQGAKPVFIDSDRISWNMNPDLLREALEVRSRIGKLPKAVLLVHLYGQCADIEPILSACNEYNIPLIEDAAEALGATYKGRNPGTFGRIGIYSFNGNKIITTSGGGMLVSDEAELRQFKEKNKVVSLPEEASKALEMLTELQKQISNAKSQMADVAAQSLAIRNQLGMTSKEAVTMTGLSQSDGVQEVVKQLQQIESELVIKRQVFLNSHPEIVKLEDRATSFRNILKNRIAQASNNAQIQPNPNLQIGELKQQLTSELVRLESQSLGLKSQTAAQSDLEATYRQRLDILPKLEQQQRELERKVQAAQLTYSLLLQKLQESRIAETQNLGNAQIINQAETPDEPISSPTVNYLSAGLLGLLASMATMYLLESRDKFIKTIDEARDFMGLTLLGVIPSFSKPKSRLFRGDDTEVSSPRIVVRDTPRSPISEAYRMLRANLKFISADKELKVIVVTSSVPKEGKSTVAANLAMSLAQMERRVLLVDGDLHRPIQHQIWDLPNSEGLSNVIVGQSDLRSAIAQVMDNLYVLPSGLVPPSPASLLDSKRMATLMDLFGASFDCVIIDIDTPALSVGADAASLGQMADGVLFVVRPGVVDIASAAFAKDLLEKSGQNVLGQVVNGIIAKNEPYSNYYFNNEEYNSQESVSPGNRELGVRS